jgi:hypothetical protein
MAKKKAAESAGSEEAKLKQKVSSKRTGHSNPKGDAALRALRKRLKREQRKRRALALRRKHAAGKKGAAAPAK